MGISKERLPIYEHTSLAILLSLGMTGMAQAEATDVKTIVSSANTAWNQALNSGDAHALAAQYAEDATLSPGNGQILVGRAQIEQLFASFVKNGVHNHQLKLDNAGGDGKLIYQTAKWNANGAAAADGKLPAFGGVTSSVLEKNADGKWLIRTHVWNLAN